MDDLVAGVSHLVSRAARHVGFALASSHGGVLQRIEAPSLVITADRSALQSVEKVRKYQQAIRNSRLVVLRSDAYHVAVAKPDECVASVLAFIRENA